MSRSFTDRFPFAQYPAVRVVLLFAVGIALQAWGGGGLLLWVMVASVIAGLWAAMEYVLRVNVHPVAYRLAIPLYVCGVMAFGGAWKAYRAPGGASASAALLTAYQWEPITVRGRILALNTSASGKKQLDVAADTVFFEGSLPWTEPMNLRLLVDPQKTRLPATATLGAVVRLRAQVYPLEPPRNPHDFDYQAYLQSKHIDGQAVVKAILGVRPPSTWWSWPRLRQSVLSLINQNFSTKTVPLAKALLLGHKNELSNDDKKAYSRVGLSHIMAVSGLHVGFLLVPFWLAIPFFWTLPYGRHAGLALLGGALFIYAGLTGFSASVVRASIMGGLLSYGRLFHKAGDSKNIAAVAAFIILLINPNELFSIGFQLSFAAVYVILLVLPVLKRLIPLRIQFRWYGSLIMIILVSFIVQLGLYPILSYYFGEFSLAGPLSNALVIPILGIMVPLAMALLFITPWLPGTAYLLNTPCRWFLHYLQAYVNEAASWSWSWVQTPPSSVFIFFTWAAIIAAIAGYRRPRLRWKLLIIVLACLVGQQSTIFVQRLQQPQLRITILDVGQGDAALIQTPNGKAFLIDTGRWSPGYNSAEHVILPHLKAEGINRLAAIFLSHPHADHIGGINALIAAIPIGTIYNSGYAYDSNLYRSYLRAANERAIPIKSLVGGQQISLDPALRLYIYGPLEGSHHSDPNEHSLVMELVYGNTQFLFTGDAGHAQEAELTTHWGNLMDTDWLKVGHHGSKTSSSASFLAAVTPQYSVVSLGRDNKFGHPHAAAVANLRASNTSLFYTGSAGALQFISDGRTIKRHEWR